MGVRVIVMRVGVIVVSRCRSLPFSNPALQSLSDLAVPSPLSHMPALKAVTAYCAAAPAEANEFAGLVANFFFAVSTQAANS